MSLSTKLVTLVGLSVSLVVTTACMKPKTQEAPKKKCNMVQRICKDGKPAVFENQDSCYQKCPEDTSTITTTSTVTNTTTATSTVTSTVTNSSATTSSEGDPQ